VILLLCFPHILNGVFSRLLPQSSATFAAVVAFLRALSIELRKREHRRLFLSLCAEPISYDYFIIFG
jgi:hypothetical protein